MSTDSEASRDKGSLSIEIVGVFIVVTLWITVTIAPMAIQSAIAAVSLLFPILLVPVLIYDKQLIWSINNFFGIDDHSSNSDKDPLTILRRQYVRGEINEGEFERKLDHLLKSEAMEQVSESHDTEFSTERD